MRPRLPAGRPGRRSIRNRGACLFPARVPCPQAVPGCCRIKDIIRQSTGRGRGVFHVLSCPLSSTVSSRLSGTIGRRSAYPSAPYQSAVSASWPAPQKCPFLRQGAGRLKKHPEPRRTASIPVLESTSRNSAGPASSETVGSPLLRAMASRVPNSAEGTVPDTGELNRVIHGRRPIRHRSASGDLEAGCRPRAGHPRRPRTPPPRGRRPGRSSARPARAPSTPTPTSSRPRSAIRIRGRPTSAPWTGSSDGADCAD